MADKGWKARWLSTPLPLNEDELMVMETRSLTTAEKCRTVGRVKAKLSE